MLSQESIHNRNGKFEIPGTQASVEFSKGKFILDIKNAGSKELPVNLARHIVAFGKTKLAYFNFMNRHGINSKNILVRNFPWYRRTTAEKRFLILDCHFFVARALGFPIPLKYRQNLSYTANHTFFPKESFSKIKDPNILKQQLLNSNDDINVGQILKGRILTHSFFSIRIEGQIYIIDSPGSGDIRVSPIEERFQEWNENSLNDDNYGFNFCFSSYEETSKR